MKEVSGRKTEVWSACGPSRTLCQARASIVARRRFQHLSSRYWIRASQLCFAIRPDRGLKFWKTLCLFAVKLRPWSFRKLFAKIPWRLSHTAQSVFMGRGMRFHFHGQSNRPVPIVMPAMKCAPCLNAPVSYLIRSWLCLPYWRFMPTSWAG